MRNTQGFGGDSFVATCLSINGASFRDTHYRLDGGVNNDAYTNNAPMQPVSLGGQEFKVLTNQGAAHRPRLRFAGHGPHRAARGRGRLLRSGVPARPARARSARRPDAPTQTITLTPADAGFPQFPSSLPSSLDSIPVGVTPPRRSLYILSDDGTC